jgi:hypothetical protein
MQMFVNVLEDRQWWFPSLLLKKVGNKIETNFCTISNPISVNENLGKKLNNKHYSNCPYM